MNPGSNVRRRIVVATGDTLHPAMAGPAIRAWHIAAALAAEHDVQLISTAGASLADDRFAIRSADDAELRELERWCDIFVFQGWIMNRRPWLRDSEKILVADVYDPMHLEQLEQGRDGGDEVRLRAVMGAGGVLNEQLLRADFMLCASERQRDFWLGHLAALGRINPATYDDDPSLRTLIDVVPFGVSDDPPVAQHRGIRDRFPAIGDDDKVVVWGGGIYNWFDPLILIDAVDVLRSRIPDIRLVFLGGRHPNPEIPEMQMAVAAHDRAARLGLTDKHVFFNEDWIPYGERQDYLLDADVGVSTHRGHVEADFSFRTRILDYFWAGLPVVASGGDALGDLVAARGVGRAVPTGDLEALVAALDEVLDETVAAGCRERIHELAAEFSWSRTLRPLVRFCRTPRRAPDLIDASLGRRFRRGQFPLRAAPAPVPGFRIAHSACEVLRKGGPTLLMQKVVRRVRSSGRGRS